MCSVSRLTCAQSAFVREEWMTQIGFRSYGVVPYFLIADLIGNSFDGNSASTVARVHCSFTPLPDAYSCSMLSVFERYLDPHYC